MLRIPCSRCHTISYTDDVESFHSCPTVDSCQWEIWADRRREARMEQKKPFILSYQGHHFEASTLDLSEREGYKDIWCPP